MATTTLSAEKDPMGAAISDYFNHHRADRLRVFSSQFEEDEIPVKELFRSMPSMPMLERTALQMATGQILDVGAGSGCHALALQDMGKECGQLTDQRMLRSDCIEKCLPLSMLQLLWQNILQEVRKNL